MMQNVDGKSQVDPLNSRKSLTTCAEDFRHVLKASFEILEKCLQP